MIVLWKEGGGEPIYVCDSHAKQLGRSREHLQDARIVSVLPEQNESPAQRQNPSQTQQIIESKSDAVTKPDKSPSPEPAPSFAEAKAERTIFEVRSRPSVRDTAYGNSAKAMVDEAIWNLAPGNYQVYRAALSQGKSSSEAAEAAGGQLAFIHRKIGDYTLKLEAIFSSSQATINVAETIDKPLEQAMFDVINNDAMSDSEKDAAIEQLGMLQELVKQGLRGEMTPMQANKIVLAIGDRLEWGGNSGVSETFKTVCRALFSGLRAALSTAVPEAQNLHDKLTNLYAAKAEMEAR